MIIKATADSCIAPPSLAPRHASWRYRSGGERADAKAELDPMRRRRRDFSRVIRSASAPLREQ